MDNGMIREELNEYFIPPSPYGPSGISLWVYPLQYKEPAITTVAGFSRSQVSRSPLTRREGFSQAPVDQMLMNAYRSDGTP